MPVPATTLINGAWVGAAGTTPDLTRPTRAT